MINITINGSKVSSKSQSIWDLITLDKKLIPSQVVIEYNENILNRDLWKSIILKEGDKLEILSFVGGGKI